ncbi:hypothetical protein Y032_0389g530 [Ancylostoma ceylanicum]|uniref:Large ribosomal subunit protein uL2 n=1 Tax=Ancylostoma ceylanicum TaxID=53326 RepID=A0A016RSF7_9BILA|nr:hypothetical protein Y032_0389g530 [Ancylostoma ceylanicum]
MRRGNCATVTAHNPETKETPILLQSGAKKDIQSAILVVIGFVTGGGRSDKSTLKAGSAYHKYNCKRNNWSGARVAAMNLAEHPWHRKGSSHRCPSYRENL